MAIGGQGAGAKQAGYSVAHGQRAAGGGFAIDQREIAFGVRTLPEQLHHIEHFFGYGKSFGKAFRNGQGPQIQLFDGDSFDGRSGRQLLLKNQLRAVLQRRGEHIGKFADVVAALAELFDKRAIGQRAGFHAHGFGAGTVKILEAVHVVIGDGTVESQGHGLRDR